MYAPPTAGMVDVYVEQRLNRSIDGWIDCRMIEEMVACLDLHMVRFVDAEVSLPGDRVICHFLAPDIESVRRVMHGAGVNAESFRTRSATDGTISGTV